MLVLLSIEPLGINLSVIIAGIQKSSFKKMHLKKLSAKYQPFCPDVNVWRVNTLRPRQDGGHFPDGVFKCIFLNENAWISLKISLRFFPKGPINNIPALIQIMAWHRPGDKPLFEPMMVKLPTYICVTRPQWVKNIHKSTACQVIFVNSRIYYSQQWLVWIFSSGTSSWSNTNMQCPVGGDPSDCWVMAVFCYLSFDWLSTGLGSVT